MRAIKFTILASLLFMAAACKKNANDDASITLDEAADIAVSSISVNSFGFGSVADNISANALTLNAVAAGGVAVNATGPSRQACGTTLTDSASNSGSNGSVSFTSFHKYVRTLTCNANSQPDNLVNNITFKGSFDGPRLTSTDSGIANVKIAGLTSAATNFVINGTYNRTGTFTSKVGAKASGSSLIFVTASNVVLSKPGRDILSGTATVTISGSTKKGAFNYTGNIVFTGSNTAKLTISGTVYTINLLTGAFTKA